VSANIYYHQVKPIKSKEVPTYAPSSFMETLEGVFGERLPTFTKDDFEKLRVLEVTHKGKPNPFTTLIKAIEKYEVIALSAEY